MSLISPRYFGSASLLGFGLLAVAVLVGAGIATGHSAPTAFVVFGFLFGAWFLCAPEVALLAFVASRPLVDTFVYIHLGSLTIGQVWGLALIGFGLAYLWMPGSALRSSLGFPAAFLLVYAAIGARGDSSVFEQFWGHLAGWLLLVICIERLASTARGQRMVISFMWLAAALSAATMIYNIGANRYGAAYYNLTFSADTLGQAPFAFAAFAVLVTPLVLAGMLGPGARKGGLWIVGALAIGIVLSYVRTTLIAFAIVVFVGAVIALRRRQHHALRRSAFAMVAVGCVLGYFALDRLAQRFSNLLLITQSGSARLAAGSGRLGIWTAVWDGATHSVQSVLVGSGSGASFGYVSEGYGGRFWAHNDFLEFFASGGLIGIGLYFALLVWIIRSVIALRRTAGTNQDVRDFAALAAATVCAYVAISIMSGVVFSLQSSLVMAVLVGLVRAMTRTPGATFLEAAACAEPSESAGRRIRGGADGLRQALT